MVFITEECNPNKNQKILIAIYDIIADMLSNKKLNPIVSKLFIWRKKLNISLIFFTQSYFAIPKNIKLNLTHYFGMKIPKRRNSTNCI